jgi:hypothetical protein
VEVCFYDIHPSAEVDLIGKVVLNSFPNADSGEVENSAGPESFRVRER